MSTNNVHETKLNGSGDRVRRTIFASLALAMLATSVVVEPTLVFAAAADASEHRITVDEDGSSSGQLLQGTKDCGESFDSAIFTNASGGMQSVTLYYSHGCSAVEWLGPAMKAEGKDPEWIDGCAILNPAITARQDDCTVHVPAGSSIVMVQAGYEGSSGSKHSWQVVISHL